MAAGMEPERAFDQCKALRLSVQVVGSGKLKNADPNTSYRESVTSMEISPRERQPASELLRSGLAVALVAAAAPELGVNTSAQFAMEGVVTAELQPLLDDMVWQRGGSVVPAMR